MDKRAQIAKRLKELIAKRGWTKAEFARRAKIPKQHVDKYLQNELDPENLLLELHKSGEDLEWLLHGAEHEKSAGSSGVLPKHSYLEMDLQRIPVFEYARAGSKSLVFDGEPSYYIATSRSKDDSRFGVVVKGNSMEPEIREGEIVVVSKKRDVKDGDVCLVLFKDAEACLRRVYFHDHGVTLTSANEKDYPPTLHKKSEIRIVYRMVQKITNY